MSKIDDLIKGLCPDGVEFKRLGAICNKIKTGGQRNKSTLSKTRSSENQYPVINGGISESGFTNEFNTPSNTITVSQGGASSGFVNYMTENFWAGAHCYVVSPSDESYLNNRYLYFILKNSQNLLMDKAVGAGIPGLNSRVLNEYKIPIPPLEVQKEIVRVLDSFTELEAELEARKKQYEYYRNTLLTFEDDVMWKPMGEVGELIRGSGLQKKDFTEEGFPCIHYGQLYTYYDSEATDTKSFTSEEVFQKLKKALRGDVLIAGTSENINDVCKPCYWNGHETIGVSGDMFIFRPNKDISGKYLTYVLQSDSFMTYKRRYVTGTKVIRLSADSLKRFKISIPPLEKQKQIVSILDKFEKLTNDISVGLPAEIEARRKQYEYYRNKLLTFKELECSR